MEFKKLELKSENKGLKGIIASRHFITSAISILIGAIAGFGYFYFTEGRHMDTMIFSDALSNVFIGAFLGFFVTNSPCARNRC